MSDIPGITSEAVDERPIEERLLMGAELSLEYLRTAPWDRCRNARYRRDCARMRIEHAAKQLRVLGLPEDADRIERELQASFSCRLKQVHGPALELAVTI